MNKQREVVYGFRSEVINSDALREIIYDVFNDLILTQCETLLGSARDSRPRDLFEWLASSFPISIREEELSTFAGSPEEAAEMIYKRVEEAYQIKSEMEDPEVVGIMERQVILHCIDTEWQEYLRSLDDLRDGVRLRAYGQRDPLVEYKREASILFEELMGRIKGNICSNLFRSSTSAETLMGFINRMQRGGRRVEARHASVSALNGAGLPTAPAPAPANTPADAGEMNSDTARALAEVMASAMTRGSSPGVPQTREAPKVGRNDPCPCGSGKKYKRCCGVETPV